MLRCVVSITAKDRPGIIMKIYEAVADSGGNVVYNFSYVEDATSKIVIVADLPDDAVDYVAKSLAALFIEEGEFVEVAPLGPETLDRLSAIAAQSPNAATGLLRYLHPEERVHLLTRLDEETRAKIYRNAPLPTLAESLPYAPAEILREMAAALKPRDLAHALEALDPDDMADVLQVLDHDTVKAVTRHLSEDRKKAVENLLRYKPDTAGGLMTTHVLAAPPDAKVGKVLEELTSGKYEIGDEAYVVDVEGRLIGVAPLSRLAKEDPAKAVQRVMKRDFVAVQADADQKEVATVLMRHDLTKVPVVDKEGRLMGVVTVDDVLDVVKHETLEETLAGFGKVRTGYIDNYMLAPVKTLYVARAPWILALAVLSFFTSAVIASFEEAIEKYVILAAFIPLVIDSGGNIGSQAAALVIRAFALGQLAPRDTSKVVKKELTTGLMVGASAFPLVFAMALALAVATGKTAWQAAATGLAIGVSIVLTLTASSALGALIVFGAYKAKMDPATMSAATITTVVDLTGSLLYLSTATAILEALAP